MIRYAKSTPEGPEKVKTDNTLAAIYILYVLYDKKKYFGYDHLVIVVVL